MPACVFARRNGKDRARRFPRLSVGAHRGKEAFRFVRLRVKIFELDVAAVRLRAESSFWADGVSIGCLLHWRSQVVPAGQ